ncbi:MAG: DNA polymerase I [Thermoguttaceae bacterium]|nr:DNA polymerase I [Thermoguttaceae bacterium]
MDLTNQKIFVIDAYGLVYQVFHALPPMYGKSGEIVNAVFGFTRDLFMILEHQKPDFLFCAFDLHAPTFRSKLYSDYKATREKMPEELIEQIPRIRELLDALKIPVLALEGFEADDILATMAERVPQLGGKCVLVTSDKDSRQLISDSVSIFSIRRNKYLDREFLLQDWGITPEQVVDYQALVGDSSDNVPGIALIGPKAAKDLLVRFGSLEEILKPENLEEYFGPKPSKKKENLLNGLETARLCQTLVRLDRHVPIDVDWEAGDVRNFDFGAALPIFRQYAFKSMIQKAEQFAAKTQNPLMIDFDNPEPDTGPKSVKVTGNAMDFATKTVELPEFDGTYTPAANLKDEKTLILPPELFTDEQFKPLIHGESQTDLFSLFEAKTNGELEAFLNENRDKLADPAMVKIGLNLKKARNLLRLAGFEMRGPQFDVLVARYILEPEKAEDDRKNPPEVTLKLYHSLVEKLHAAGLETVCYRLEFPLMEVLAEMEYWGIFVRRERLAEISARFAARIDELTQELYALAGETVNLNSPVQLRKVLFETLELPVLHKTKTGPSTDAQTLEELALQHEFPAKLIEYRQLVKLQNTYVESLPKLISERDGRIHTTFNQTVTATGRLSSSDPNLQNIPVRSEEGKLIRSAFVPENPVWSFVSADYSQIELRVLAHFCGDENLCEAFRHDQDIHARVASQIHGIPLEEVTKDQRRAAKTVNFGVIYGQSAFGLAAQLKIPQDDARAFIQAYFMQFPAIQSFLDSVLDFARTNGYVQTLFGRRRAIEGVREVRKGQLTLAERMAVNTVIQGTAADLMKLAMLRVYARVKREKLQSRLLLQIHDELMLECPPEEIETVKRLLEEEMTSAWSLSVPLKVDVEVGKEW